MVRPLPPLIWFSRRFANIKTVHYRHHLAQSGLELTDRGHQHTVHLNIGYNTGDISLVLLHKYNIAIRLLKFQHLLTTESTAAAAFRALITHSRNIKPVEFTNACSTKHTPVRFISVFTVGGFV